MDAYTFWKLLWQLPYYDGAVTVAIKQWYAKNKSPKQKPKQDYPLAPSLVPAGEKVTEVPIEAFNLAAGSNLISFGRG